MNSLWVIGIVMAAGLDAQTAGCNVYVDVNNGAEIPFGVLFNAMSRAARMFGEIGVNVRMRDGAPKHAPEDACVAPIVLEIEDAPWYRGSAEALAYATPYAQSGTRIHILADRIRRAYEDRSSGFQEALLAHVMAHEITHVLEGVVRHSDFGVTKAMWRDADYREMQRHPLPFAPEDVTLIHDGLARHAATQISRLAH